MDKGFTFVTQESAENKQNELFLRTQEEGSRFTTVYKKPNENIWFFIVNSRYYDLLTPQETTDLQDINNTFYPNFNILT